MPCFFTKSRRVADKSAIPRRFLWEMLPWLLGAGLLWSGRAWSAWPDPSVLPAREELPELLHMWDGRRVDSPEMWMRERRPELIELFQHYMYGTLPPKPGAVTGTVTQADRAALDGHVMVREVAIQMEQPHVPPIHLLLVLPKGATNRCPVILGMNYFGNHTLLADPRIHLNENWMPERGVGVVNHRATEESRGSRREVWPFEEIVARGYAVATFYNGDVDPDAEALRGLQLYFHPTDLADACGTIGAWAWGLQRAVDYLVTAPGIDSTRIAVAGHSRLGKAALLAAALDERIAMAIPHQAGCGGSAPSRARVAIGKPFNTLDTAQTKPPETVADINGQFPHWFNSRFKEFNHHPERLPFDQHALVALCAPRPVLFTNGRSDTWINPAGQFAVLRGASSVYRLLGADGFDGSELPADGRVAGSGALGYYLRPGAHSLILQDWMTFLDFADRQWARAETNHTKSAAGVIGIDPAYPRSFLDAEGQRYFPLGDTAYFLIAQPTNVIAHFIDTRRAHHFNFVRMMAMAEGFWPFGGTPRDPDYSMIREDRMRKWDWVFDYAASRGMNIELILWGYGVDGGEGLWGDNLREDIWIDELARRFRDRSNLFMYTVANEFERYPDGRYNFAPDDVVWAQRVASRIRAIDPAHLIGCHPSVWITDQDEPGQGSRPFAQYKSFSQSRPPIVWPLWEGSDVNVAVTQNNEGVQRRRWGDYDGAHRGLTYFPTTWKKVEYPARWTPEGWVFEAAGLEDCIARDWDYGHPVVNAEFGYQFEPGYETEHGFTTRQSHHPDTVRKKAWKIAVSGGYFAAGFVSAAVSRRMTTSDVDQFRPAALEVLYKFFTAKTEFWKMHPQLDGVAPHNVLLADPGHEYVAYFPRGGSDAVDIAAGAYQVVWLHSASGAYYPQPGIQADHGRWTFEPPLNLQDDWALHLRRFD